MPAPAGEASLRHTPTALRYLRVRAGVDTMATLWMGGCDSSANGGPCTRGSWVGVSVPLSVALNFNDHESYANGGRRVPLRVQLVAAPGVEPTTSIWGVHGTLSVGASCGVRTNVILRQSAKDFMS